MTEGPVPAGPTVEFRVLTYNVRGLRAGSAAVAKVIGSANPDVVCVQEAPVGLRWRSRAAALARRSGLYVVSGGRPAAGNLLLCAARVDVVTAGEHLLSRSPGLAARGCAAAVLRIGGVEVGVIGAHFGLRAAERRRHAEEVAAIAHQMRAAGATTVVLGSDLNSKPWADEWQPLFAQFRDPVPRDASWSTYPARMPTARIDVDSGRARGGGVGLRAARPCRRGPRERPPPRARRAPTATPGLTAARRHQPHGTRGRCSRGAKSGWRRRRWSGGSVDIAGRVTKLSPERQQRHLVASRAARPTAWREDLAARATPRSPDRSHHGSSRRSA